MNSVTTKNSEGFVAYFVGDKAALAQLAVTGCLQSTYYVKKQDQIKNILDLCGKVPDEYVAKLAIYSRKKGLLKDMPALLLAILSKRNPNLLNKVFPVVADSPAIVKNFVKHIRSGITGRKSLGNRPKVLVQKYLTNLSPEQLFRTDIGNDPSIKDLINLVHPKATSEEQNAMFGYILGRDVNTKFLPQEVNQFEAFKRDTTVTLPKVPFQLLTALSLTEDHWKSIAENMTWNQTIKNLNTMKRHNVFSDKTLVTKVAAKIANKNLVQKSNTMPYEVFTTYLNAVDMPKEIKEALLIASNYSLENIPSFKGRAIVGVDVSGSMTYPVTGKDDKKPESKMTNIDVAALIAASFVKKNKNSQIIPFCTMTHDFEFSQSEDLLVLSEKLSRFRGGGTDCSLPVAYANANKINADIMLVISDNEANVSGYNSRTTALSQQWEIFKQNNPFAKMVCINISPNIHAQIQQQKDVLNVGGFNDAVFEVMENFLEVGSEQDSWAKQVDDIQL